MNESKKQELINMLRVYYCLPPYNEPYNTSAYDPFYWRSIELKFTKEEIDICYKELEGLEKIRRGRS